MSATEGEEVGEDLKQAPLSTEPNRGSISQPQNHDHWMSHHTPQNEIVLFSIEIYRENGW